MLNIRKTAFFVFFLKKTLLFRSVKLTSMERDLRPFVRPVSKGRFLNVTVWILKLRNFESIYSGDATRDVYVG